METIAAVTLETTRLKNPFENILGGGKLTSFNRSDAWTRLITLVLRIVITRILT